MIALIAMNAETSGDYSRSISIKEVDGELMRHAREIFADYKSRGVITDGNFDDMAWTLTNQKRNVGLTMLTFQGGGKKTAMEWIGCTYRTYLDCVKAYIVFALGEVELTTLQEIIKVFNRLTAKTYEEAIADTDNLNHVISLLRIIPGGSEQRDYVIDEFEEKLERLRKKNNDTNKQRELADFKSYLRFHEVLERFWQDAGNKQRLFYFPLYFWWNLTAILPLRPMEFLLTPRDCLRSDNGVNVLTIRRTKLKGGNEKIRYRIADDYELKEYVITEKLSDELRRYIRDTKNMERTELDTLFLQKPHFEYMGRQGQGANRYYTYVMLTTCLRYFYREAIRPQGADISEIHLGDTRHLAMTNLILSGGSPVICKELAGHSSIDVSSHYYSNISNLVECVTYDKYRKYNGSGSADIDGVSKYPLSVPQDLPRVSGGWCDSMSMKNGGIEDCLKVFSDKSHIGDCCRCGHYQPDNPGIRLKFFDEKTGRKQVDADSRFLIRMIELVRKGLGHEEDIGSAILRLQRSSNHYGNCLWEKYSQEDGVRWQDQEK